MKYRFFKKKNKIEPLKDNRNHFKKTVNRKKSNLLELNLEFYAFLIVLVVVL